MRGILLPILFILLMIFLHQIAGYSQTVAPLPEAPIGAISGSVKDAQGHALAGVTLSLRLGLDSSSARSTASNGSGHYSFDKLTAGDYVLAATFIGFQRQDNVKVHLASNEHLSVPPIVMIQAATNLGGVLVTAKKPFIERQVDKTILNIESDVIAAGGTAFEALKRAPGITVDKDDNIQLRGKSGVTVMLDGKLTYLSSAQISTMLKNMPASSVQTIEVITQPSARYDAAGNTGIINIRTKKLKKIGLNGVVTVGTSIAKHSRYNSSLNLNYQAGKFNFYTNYDFSHSFYYNMLRLHREVGSSPQATEFNGLTIFDNAYYNNNYKAGVDFSPSKNHTIGVQLSGYNNNGFSNSFSHTSIAKMGKRVDTFLNAQGQNPQSFKSVDYNVNYKGTLDTLGTELSTDLDYSRFNNSSHTVLSNAFWSPKDTMLSGPFVIRGFLPSTINIKVGKLDFSHPFSKKLKLETGLKYSDVTTDNTIRYDSLRSQVYVTALSQSNQFVYREKIAAVYASVNSQIKSIGLQVGLRVENTRSDGNSITLKKEVKRTYTDFFPNLAYTEKLNDHNQIGFSYTRRIDRPGYSDLNPFKFYLDQYTYSQGNPFLKPQYTNSFEATYTYKQGTFLTLNYSHTRDVSLEILTTDTLTKVSTSTHDNLASLDSYGLTFNTPFVFSNWWTLSTNLQINYNKYLASASALEGSLNAGKLGANLNLTNTFNLSHDFTIELQGFYQSPFIMGYLHFNEFHSISGGIQRSFLSKKANIKINVSDIFNTEHFGGTQAGKGYVLGAYNKNESRRLNLTFSYRFGSKSYARSQKQTGSEEEKSRVKSH